MALIGQIGDACLYFTSPEQLFDAIDRSDRWYLFEFYKSLAIIQCHWSAGSLICVCTLQIWSNNPMPLIGQTIDSCLYFESLEQLWDAIDRSYRWYLLVFYKSGAIILDRSDHWYSLYLQVLTNYPMPFIGHIVDMCLYFTSPEQLCDAISFRFLSNFNPCRAICSVISIPFLRMSTPLVHLTTWFYQISTPLVRFALYLLLQLLKTGKSLVEPSRKPPQVSHFCEPLSCGLLALSCFEQQHRAKFQKNLIMRETYKNYVKKTTSLAIE